MMAVDIFGGSNTSGEAVEELVPRWLYLECDPDYAIASAFRFMNDWSSGDGARFIDLAKTSTKPIRIDMRVSGPTS